MAKQIALSPVSGEMRVLKISVFLMIVYAALNFAAILRLNGVSGLPAILLILYRGMDAVILFSFLAFCGRRIEFRRIDLLLLIFSVYPFFVGLGRGHFSITFLNDASIYLLFLVKVVIFRSILVRISEFYEIDRVFRVHARRIIFWSGLIAVLSIVSAYVLLGAGASFYYQAPAELTFAAALLLAHGNIFGFLVLLGLALLGGKRMVMVGLLSMAVVALLAHQKSRTGMLRFALGTLIFIPFIVVGANAYFSTELIFIDKILGTFRQIQRSQELSTNFLETLMFMDTARFVEYLSLKPHLEGWPLWFGNGYGFRYNVLLSDFGYADNIEVTNAHFTPLAITAKFGLLGLGIWFVLIVKVLIAKINKRSFVQYACRLAFLAMIVQSVFAFGFFISMFTPFYIAMATMVLSKPELGRRNLPIAVDKNMGFS